MGILNRFVQSIDNRTTELIQTSAPSDIFKNKILNGAYAIKQYAIVQTPPATYSGYAFWDRWRFVNSGGASVTTGVNILDNISAMEADYPPFPYPTGALKIDVTDTGQDADSSFLSQPIEYVWTLNNKTATLSFWAAAASAFDLGIEIEQNFGTGYPSMVTPSANVQVHTATINIGTSWAKHSVTFDIPSTAGKLYSTSGRHWLDVKFWLTAGADFSANSTIGNQSINDFNLSLVQLEEGDTATTFSCRPYFLEETECMRYFQRLDFSENYSPLSLEGQGGNATGWWTFHTPMRYRPALVNTGVNDVICTTSSVPTTVTISNISIATPNAYLDQSPTESYQSSDVSCPGVYITASLSVNTNGVYRLLANETAFSDRAYIGFSAEVTN